MLNQVKIREISLKITKNPRNSPKKRNFPENSLKTLKFVAEPSSVTNLGVRFSLARRLGGQASPDGDFAKFSMTGGIFG